jgi:uncharacterized protein
VRRALVVVGKAPQPGVTKTRLCPPLSPAEAAQLYRAFLLDTLETGRSLGWDRITLIYPPSAGARSILSGIVPPGIELNPQPGRGLGAALSGAFARHASEGFDRVVLIGSDNPTLRESLIETASDALDVHDLVIGPATDGGYYLIGMDRPQPIVFERITWSTSLVYGETMARAREGGLSVASLPVWYDVDTYDDLVRLRSELADSDAAVAPRTRRELDLLTPLLDGPRPDEPDDGGQPARAAPNT